MPETNTTAMKQPLSEEVKDLLKRANKGDESLVPQVKALLDQLPELVAECGDLVKEAQQILLEWATGSALTSREAISRHVEQYRERLAATASSELEKILVDRVVISYLEVYTADVRFCQRAGPGQEASAAAQAAQKIIDRAHQRYLSAIRCLATVQRLLRPSHAPLAIATRLQVQLHVRGYGQSRQSARASRSRID